MLARDLTLAAATGGWLFACHTTTARGVALIREAKARGVHVTAEVTPHHLALTDEWLAGRRHLHWEEPLPAGTPANPDAKVNPPLRTGADIEALVAGLRDGTIDTIGTDHAPHAPRDKPADFGAAASGMLGFEVALPTLLSLVRAGALDLPTIIAKLTVAPAAVLGDAIPPGTGTFAPGAPADVTIFDPERRWTITPEALASSSKNTPLLGREVQGWSPTRSSEARCATVPETSAPPRYDLRPATAGDFAFLQALHIATLKEYVAQTWSWDDVAQAARFRAGFNPETSRIVLIDGRAVGVLAVERRPDDIFITNIALLPEQQGCGLGAAIIGDVLAEAAQAGVATVLQVLRVNPARHLYERLGFAVMGETSTHYLLRAEPANVVAAERG